MKKLVILAVTAAAFALAAGKVEASGGTLILNISGSVQYQTTNSDSTNGIVGKVKTQTFNNATVYNMISNAVANAENGLAATLPAKGIIVFDPTDSDGTNTGFFYVTDKANDFYYQLSGTNASGYYSFIELDSWVITPDDYIEFGFGYPFDGSASYNLNASGNGSLSGKSTALLYIHNNPYSYDIADNPRGFYSANTEAFEIQGILAVHLTYESDSINGGTLSLTGTGNAIIPGAYDIDDASVISGHASF